MTDRDQQSTPAVVTTRDQLTRVVRAAKTASPFIAVDVEGNGLFAYRPRLCTVQLAWEEDGATQIAIVDTLAVDPTPLSDLLGARGPTKVLHDFTFDVKLLADAGVELLPVRDTSVLARMLGRKATGLASLLSSELGIIVTKDLQQHDWGRRPLGAAEIEYLASDVRHLIALHDKLAAEARSLDIEEEVAVECTFKHQAALSPPREKKGPAYLRIKGADGLDAPTLAVLRRLVDQREQIAASWNEPPFKVIGNEVLMTLAHLKPRTIEELGRVRRGISGRLLQLGPKLVSAVVGGLSDGAVPAADLDRGPRPDRAVLAARRAKEKRLSAWRRAEAATRGVDEQVVLPGHCLAELLSLEGDDADAVAQVKGMGEKRLSRYGATLAKLLAGDAEPDDAVSRPEPAP
jgi:ribonuclease D